MSAQFFEHHCAGATVCKTGLIGASRTRIRSGAERKERSPCADLDHYTHDEKYLATARTRFRDFVRYRRTEGCAALSDVVTKTRKDRNEDYVFAETFKYYYLLFAPQAIDFDAVTFNTKAHSVRATWRKEGAPSK